MTDFEHDMQSLLYRSGCPDGMALGEYALGLLPEEQASRVQAHLRTCPACTDELQQLQHFQAELSPELEVSPVERIKTWIARLIPDFSGGGLEPALALRGEPGQVLSYEAGQAQLSLAVQEDPVQPDRRALMGLLVGAEPRGVRVHLFHRERQATLSLLDEFGNFIIAGIQPGDYELTLRGQNFEIYISRLPIG